MRMRKFLLAMLALMLMASSAAAALVDVDSGKRLDADDLGSYADGRPIYMIFSTVA